MKILDGRFAAKEISAELKSKIEKLKDKPILTIVQVGNNEASNKYIKFKIKKADNLGVISNHVKLNENITTDELLNKINELSKKTDGLIVQLPLPDHIDTDLILDSIPVEKDVDGLSSMNNKIVPATPRGIVSLLNFYDIELNNKVIGVIGQSKLVGGSLSNFLEETTNSKILRFDKSTGIDGSEEADILIVAVGQEGLIKSENIKEGAIIVDVGINTLTNGKITGDVDRLSVKEKPSVISPVPGGVGPMTVISLFLNLYDVTK